MPRMTFAEQHEEAMAVKSTETRPLWAVAANEWTRGKGWGLIVRYNHAATQAEARINYIRARGAQPCEIVSVGLAVGFKVDDNQGLRLSV